MEMRFRPEEASYVPSSCMHGIVYYLTEHFAISEPQTELNSTLLRNVDLQLQNGRSGLAVQLLHECNQN